MKEIIDSHQLRLRYQKSILCDISKNANGNKFDEFQKVLLEEFEEFGRNGFGREKEISAINTFEFEEKECEYGSFPKGVLLAMKTTVGFALEKSDMFWKFKINAAVEHIKKEVVEKNENYFGKIITKYFLENTNRVFAKCAPSKTFMTKLNEEEKKRHLEAAKKLTQEEINTVVKDSEELKKQQTKEDSEEQKKTIPTLQLKDLSKRGTDYSLEQMNSENIEKIFYKENSTNGIFYFSLCFDLKECTLDELCTANLLGKLLKSFDTEKHNFIDLNTLIERYFGRLVCTIQSTSNKRFGTESAEMKKVVPYLEITGKLLYSNMKEAIEVLGEMMSQIKFDKKTLEKKLKTVVSDAENRMKNQPASLLVMRSSSYMTGSGYVQDYTNGLASYRKFKYYSDNFETIGDTLLAKLQSIYSSVFNKEKCTVYFSCEKQNKEDTIKTFMNIANVMKTPETIEKMSIPNYEQSCEGFERQKISEIDFTTLLKAKNEALVFPVKNNYVALSFNFADLKFKLDSSFKALCEITEKLFLWDKVRVEGGTYGVYALYQADGVFVFYSYRDPHIFETLDIYKQIPELIEHFSLDEKILENYLIGIFADIDKPRNAETLLQFSKTFHQENTIENYKEIRENMFNATPETVKNTVQIIKEGLKHANICVIGNEEMIQKKAEIFGEVVQVFKK
ncbi:presequence protease, putative [Entamoeba invadens IP1]|uniref:Presequence protease, putative n=1 Tax=Entamoeba invadens IP1 TaxID=370355 RepID=A0A0A1UCJ9_ENTIV|nr:presequence protease, putative [Entamoeba invadens IP1]ELP93654.1 presequence protease, putative [Entamoeba invadens IP1]|eukprot:XP_004260425.1 presequence protease, putative [Entamoeba invadens IP1]